MTADKYDIIIQRSKRRKKTLQAILKTNTIKILTPFHIGDAEINKFLDIRIGYMREFGKLTNFFDSFIG